MPRPEGVLSHVELNVSDLEEAIAFYDWFLSELGYARYQEWDKGRSWRLGHTYIVLGPVADFRDTGPISRR